MHLNTITIASHGSGLSLEPPAYSLSYPNSSGSSTKDLTWSPNSSATDLSLSESMEAQIHTMHAFQAEVEGDIKKQAHDLSPADKEHDGEKHNKSK